MNELLEDQQPIENPVETVQMVVLDQQQADQIHTDLNAINQTATWIFIVLAFILGIHLMSAFWTGWRSTK